MKTTFLKAGIVLLLIVQATTVLAQENLNNKINIVFGMNQLLASGFNVEGNLFYKRFAFDYSHGVSLNFSGSALTGDEKDQKLAIHLPYTTGFGIGYRFTDAFNLRLEPKWHRFELYYDGDTQNSSTRIAAYNTFTLGIGAYYNWLPFKRKDGFLKNVMVAPSVRFWPQLSSTLDGDKIEYENRETGRTETHEAMEVGFGNTPWIVNVSIGYSIPLSKK